MQNMSQTILESLPILPKGLRPANLADQVSRPDGQKQGFRHTTGEWNYLYMFDKRWYRLPESLAIVLLNETHTHNKRYHKH